MRNLAEDRSIIIKPVDKGYCVVIWDQEGYLAEVYRQLSSHSTYTDFTEKSNRILRDCAIRKLSQRKNWNIFHLAIKMLVL